MMPITTVHLPPPSVRVIYSGFDLAVKGVSTRRIGRGLNGHTEDVEGADDVALGTEVGFVESVLLEAIHTG